MRGLEFDPVGKRLAVGKHRICDQIDVSIFDVESRELLQTLTTPDVRLDPVVHVRNKPQGVSALAWNPDGDVLYVGTRWGAVHVWDLTHEPPNLTSQIVDSRELHRVIVSANPQFLFCLGSELSILNLTDRQKLPVEWSRVHPAQIAWSERQRRLLIFRAQEFLYSHPPFEKMIPFGHHEPAPAAGRMVVSGSGDFLAVDSEKAFVCSTHARGTSAGRRATKCNQWSTIRTLCKSRVTIAGWSPVAMTGGSGCGKRPGSAACSRLPRSTPRIPNSRSTEPPTASSSPTA